MAGLWRYHALLGAASLLVAVSIVYRKHIAGIVLASHAKLATRNAKHFEEIASSLVNPWEA